MIGTDIVSIERIRAVYLKQPERFVARILSLRELAVFNQRKQSIPFLANRYAAKEAIAKALGTGIAKGVNFNDIEILPNEHGAPQVTLHGEALAQLAALSGSQVYVSVSDEQEYAVAFAMIR